MGDRLTNAATRYVNLCDCTWDDCGPDLSVAALAFGLRRRWSWARWVDSNDTAPGLETMPVALGLAVVVVIADRGPIHQLQRNGVRVCDVAQFGALPVTAEMMDDAGLPRHAAAFRRWHDVDRDHPSPNDNTGVTP